VEAGRSLAVPFDAAPTRSVSLDAVPSLATPVPTAPSDGQRYSHFPRTTTLSWQQVAGASGNRVEVEFGNRVGAEVVWTPWLSQAVTGGSWTFDFVGDQPGRWRVSALDVAGAHTASPPSAWRTFGYGTAPVLDVPQQFSPAAGERFSHFPRTTTVGWHAVAGADSYHVEVEFAWRDQSGATTWAPLLAQDLEATSLTFDFVGAQPGRWRVSATDRSGSSLASPPSDWRTFSYTV
jgi:hypothetical protein